MLSTKMKLRSLISLFLISSLIVVARADSSSQNDAAESIPKDPSHSEFQSNSGIQNDGEPSRTLKGSEMIKNLLEHFQNPEAATKPLPIPDPMFMPDRTYPLVTNVLTTNVTAWGVSYIRVRNFTSDAVKMKVHFVLCMPRLMLTGNYSYEDWLRKNYFGSFNITLINALIDCNGNLEVTRDGELAASKIAMDISSKDDIIIQSSGSAAGLVGFMVNTFGSILFNAVKPYFLSIISDNIRSNVNEHLKLLKIMFPNSIQPVDLAIAEGRKFVKSRGLDPYHVPNYLHAKGIYSIDLTNIVLTGLSSFYRVGDIKLLMDNHILNAIVEMGTEELTGSCTWEASIGGIFSKIGSSSFTIDYIDVMVSVNQSMDIRKKPLIVDFSVKVGNVQLRTEGLGILDYIAEAGVNVLPNLLRYQILQAVEKPIRRKLQEAMDGIDIERSIQDKLPLIDQQLYERNDNVTVIEDNFVEGDAPIREKEEEQDSLY